MTDYDPPASVQVIDQDKNFNKEIPAYLVSAKLGNVGLAYHLISVFGSQSTGKSTLLNALFETNFDTMDQQIRRQQTTKGIWMANSTIKSNEALVAAAETSPQVDGADFPAESSVLVLDVEGTDGRERGEDQDFERKAALFALSTSEVLIVNLWESQVGLYQGANMALLRTVMEVNLSLFHTHKYRSLLLFVIRDHLGITPVESLGETLRADLLKIWEGLSKPEGCEDAKLSDYFDLQFVALAHKILQPEKFYSGVTELRHRFVDAEDPQFVFKPEYHRKVPLDGWPMYAEKIWEQIDLNKDLDLPTQQVLVAQFRCEELFKYAYDRFEVSLGANRISTEPNQLLEDLGWGELKALKETAIQEYDQNASRYAKDVYLQKRLELEKKLDGKLSFLYKQQLSLLRKAAFALFNDSFQQKLASQSRTSFAELLRLAECEALAFFTETAEPAALENNMFDYSTELAELQDQINEARRVRTTKELNSIKAKTKRRMKQQLKEMATALLMHPKKGMWDEIVSRAKEIEEKTLEKFAVASEAEKSETNETLQVVRTSPVYDLGLGLSAEENEKIIQSFRQSMWLSLKAVVKDFCTEQNVLSIVREKFEDKFRYDENGVPRLWKPSDDIDGAFAVAKEEALSVLPLLSIMAYENGTEVIPDVELPVEREDSDIEEEDGEESTGQQEHYGHILSELQLSSIVSAFKKQSDGVFIDAKRSTIQSTSRIPFFMYLLLLALGWNELMAVLRNPLFFVLILVLGATAYITWSLNLWGPIIKVTEAMTSEAIGISKQKLREFLQDGDMVVKASGKQEEEKPVETIPLDDLSTEGKKVEAEKAL